MSNFWKEMRGAPIFALAPMEDVTDTVFREVVMSVSSLKRLQIVYTEFTNVDGMNHPVGKLRVGERLIVNKSEKKLLNEKGIKLVAQIWGKDPEVYHKVVKEISERGEFDGIDINMGCPVKNVVKNGCCSALISTPELAKEIVIASKEATDLPVSVKTRLGFKEVVTESWIEHLLSVKPAAIILHGRIQKQMSEGEANWQEIAKAVKVRDQIDPEVAFIGNGDVLTYEEGLTKCSQFGVDGVMVGRGIFHDPWFFAERNDSPEVKERLSLLLKHTTLYDDTWAGNKNFNILKRFFKIYTNGFDGAAKLRSKLMEVKSRAEVIDVVNSFIELVKL